MKRLFFYTFVISLVAATIVACLANRLLTEDVPLRLAVNSIFITVFLSVVSVISSKYFSDQTTERILDELKKKDPHESSN